MRSLWLGIVRESTKVWTSFTFALRSFGLLHTDFGDRDVHFKRIGTMSAL